MPTAASSWFEVDRKGLALVLARADKSFVLSELLQNSWDEPGVTTVTATIERIPGTRDVLVIVEDDAPGGFSDLSTAYTMFAQSKKLSDATLRGRFGVGEKRAMALAKHARLISTKGGWIFDKAGRRPMREKRPKGSMVELTIEMTAAELAQCHAVAARVIPPAGIHTTYNGVALDRRQPLVECTAALPTEVAHADAGLRPTTRIGKVAIHPALTPGAGWLYEMGIPVVETGDTYDVNVGQRVPLNMDRDNVTPAYLRKIRTLVLNQMHESLESKDACAPWVRDALEDPKLDERAVQAAVRARFGERAVIFDPSDPEANKLAVSKEYVVVHGGHLSGAEWENVRRVGAILPAGQVTPSPKPYGDGPPVKLIDPENWSEGMRQLADASIAIAWKIAQIRIYVHFENEPTQRYQATFGDHRLAFNIGKLGRAWCDRAPLAEILELIIHELGHHYSLDHLSEAYHDALCMLGGRLAVAVAEDPKLIAWRTEAKAQDLSLTAA